LHAKEAKGVILDRGKHGLEAALEQWVAGQDETMDCFAREQLFVTSNQPVPQCGHDCSSDSCREEASEMPPPKRVKHHSDSADVAGPEEVRAACARLVAGLPRAFREPMRRDAEALAALLLRLCPDSPWMTMQVEVMAKLAAYTRWHQDNYTGRAMITSPVRVRGASTTLLCATINSRRRGARRWR